MNKMVQNSYFSVRNHNQITIHYCILFIIITKFLPIGLTDLLINNLNKYFQFII